MRHRTVVPAVVALVVGLGLMQPALAVIFDEVEDFESGTTEGWTSAVAIPGVVNPNPPTNVADGGPAGAGDNFLRVVARGGGGPGSRLSIINLSTQWSGHYIAAGVSAIAMDVRNFGASDLELRVLLADPTPTGPPTNVFFSAESVSLPALSDWTAVVFPIRPSDLIGVGDIDTLLRNVTEVRFFHNPLPAFGGPPNPIPAIVAELGMDNIRATAVSEPALLFLAGLIGLGAVVGRRRTLTPRI